MSLELSTATAAISNSVPSDNQFGVFVGNGGSPIARLYATAITGSTPRP